MLIENMGGAEGTFACVFLLMAQVAANAAMQTRPLQAFCTAFNTYQVNTCHGRLINTGRSYLPLGVVNSGTSTRWRGAKRLLRCGLTRISTDVGHKLLPTRPTKDQWSHYFGGSDVQRVGKFFEVSAIAFLGLWACYFTSFFIGVGMTSILGVVRVLGTRCLKMNTAISDWARRSSFTTFPHIRVQLHPVVPVNRIGTLSFA
ncbi:unnamed protein product [Choristocarpus tenellus]